MNNSWTPRLRSAALWGIPLVLVGALVWSFLPRGGEQMTPPKLPAPLAPAGSASSAGSASTAASPAGRSDAARAAAPQRPGAGVASGEIKVGNLVGTDDKGHVQWKVLADDMTLGQGQQTVALHGVRATFFDNDGSRMLVNGDTGTYDTRSREVTIAGSVHGVTSTGRELFADTVFYSPQGRRVEGRGHVRVVQERVIMYADSMTSNLMLGQTRFFGNVHMTLR